MKITPNKLTPFAVEIVAIDHAGYSTNGNARFEIIFDDRLGWAGVALTKSDAGFTDAIKNRQIKVGSWVRLAFTRSGRISDMVLSERGER